ncbi:MAG: addiction module protein [Candidatus Sigynarchaeota archaeon]
MYSYQPLVLKDTITSQGPIKTQIKDIPGISKLNIPEKILLVEDLWDSIIYDESAIPVPESHRQEIRKRIASRIASI